MVKIRVRVGSLGYNNKVYSAGDTLEVSKQNLEGFDSGDYEVVEKKAMEKKTAGQ